VCTALGSLQPDELIATLTQSAGVDLVIDAGRLDRGSPLLSILSTATRTVLLLRPFAADVLHMAPRVDALRATARTLDVVVVGQGPHPAGEIAETLGLEVIATLPSDPQAAAMLQGRQHGTARALDRSALIRAARQLGMRLAHAPASATAIRMSTPAQGSIQRAKGTA
jgi:hypothetical protein